MWIMVMFDLPVLTKRERKAAARFRLTLLDVGFEMAQYSVYVKFCVGQSKADTVAKEVQKALPKDGKVNILFITDRQYERIISFQGTSRQPNAGQPRQFALF